MPCWGWWDPVMPSAKAPMKTQCPGRRAIPCPTFHRGDWPQSLGTGGAEHASSRSIADMNCSGRVGCGRWWSMPGVCRQRLPALG